MDTPENLEKQFAGDTVIQLTACTDSEHLCELLGQVQNVQLVSTTDEEDRCYAELKLTDEDEQGACLAISKAFMEAGIPVMKLNPAHASLEDVFIRLTAEASIKEVR